MGKTANKLKNPHKNPQKSTLEDVPDYLMA